MGRPRRGARLGHAKQGSQSCHGVVKLRGQKSFIRFGIKEIREAPQKSLMDEGLIECCVISLIVAKPCKGAPGPTKKASPEAYYRQRSTFLVSLHGRVWCEAPSQATGGWAGTTRGLRSVEESKAWERFGFCTMERNNL